MIGGGAKCKPIRRRLKYYYGNSTEDESSSVIDRNKGNEQTNERKKSAQVEVGLVGNY